MKIIASIDYGKSSGLIIAKVIVDTKTIFLSNVYTGTILEENIPLVIWLVESYYCDNVILERCPSQAVGYNRRAYDDIRRELLQAGFTFGNIKENKTFALIGPGIWKPFMKKSAIHCPNYFNLFTRHEKDAANMLLYAIQITWKNKKIKFLEKD